MNRNNITEEGKDLLAKYCIENDIQNPKEWLEKLDVIDSINIIAEILKYGKNIKEKVIER